MRVVRMWLALSSLVVLLVPAAGIAGCPPGPDTMPHRRMVSGVVHGADGEVVRFLAATSQLTGPGATAWFSVYRGDAWERAGSVRLSQFYVDPLLRYAQLESMPWDGGSIRIALNGEGEPAPGGPPGWWDDCGDLYWQGVMLGRPASGTATLDLPEVEQITNGTVHDGLITVEAG